MAKKQSAAWKKAFAVYLCNARKRCGDIGDRACMKLRANKRKSRRTGVVRYSAPKSKPCRLRKRTYEMSDREWRDIKRAHVACKKAKKR